MPKGEHNMGLSSHQLQTFLTIIDQGSFSAAAHKLGLTQPAVTTQIKKLEQECGAILFDRSMRQISLTAAGAALLPYARAAAENDQRAQDALDVLDNTVSGSLTVTASIIPGCYVLPHLLAEFEEAYPAVRANLIVDNSHKVIAQIESLDADLAVVDAKFFNHNIHYEELGEFEIICICAPDEPLAKSERPVILSQLLQKRWIMRNPDSGPHRLLQRLCADKGLNFDKLQKRMELNTCESVIGCVEKGMGIAAVSRFAADKALLLGSIAEIPVEDQPWYRPLYLAFPSRVLSRVALAFVEFLRKNYDSSVPQSRGPLEG